MYRLTERRRRAASEILDRHTRILHDSRSCDALHLEMELRRCWDLGYQELKGVMIDMVAHHQEYAHLAAWYMEHINPTGVVVEFQESLEKLYGVSYWYHDPQREEKARAYWEQVFACISQFDLSEKTGDKSFIEVTSAVNQRLMESFLLHPHRLMSTTSRQFEEIVAEIFHGFGFRVELTAATRDGGRDVIAVGNEKIAATKYLIECKRYAAQNKVGVQPVRGLLGVVQDERATKGIIVTTSAFTTPAEELLKRQKWVLEGRDFEGLLAWLKEYQRLRFTK